LKEIFRKYKPINKKRASYILISLNSIFLFT